MKCSDPANGFFGPFYALVAQGLQIFMRCCFCDLTLALKNLGSFSWSLQHGACTLLCTLQYRTLASAHVENLHRKTVHLGTGHWSMLLSAPPLWIPSHQINVIRLMLHSLDITAIVCTCKFEPHHPFC